MKAGALATARPDLQHERRLLRQGVSLIAGIDEVGRGAWAGPVVAAAVCLPLHQRRLSHQLRGVRDSKRMTPAARQRWDIVIRKFALSLAVGQASVEEIDALGIAPATRLAMQRAVAALWPQPQHLLIDYLRLPAVSLPQTSLPHGDARSLSIASASIVAKVFRDRSMMAVEDSHPGYGFAHHKGYGTHQHLQALHLLGPTLVHRRSFQPIAILNGRAAAPQAPGAVT